MPSLLIANARLCLPDGRIEPGSLRVREGRITAVGPRLQPDPGENAFDAEGAFLSPGFVDIHIHGALGRDTMEASEDAFETICRYHASGGSTSLALTTIAESWQDIGRALDAVRAWRPKSGSTGARCVGVHAEGPYFSPYRRGAHLAERLQVPGPNDIAHWSLYTDTIVKITLAPELPGMDRLIPELVRAGLRVSGGHSDAWDEDAQRAFDDGMRQVTHTFNCMSTARRRNGYRVAGLAEAALSRPDVLCEVIADGHHVSPTMLRMLWNAKGADKVALVTDATAGAGLPRGDRFRLGEIDCRVGDGIAFAEDGAMAGSTSRMIDCVKTLVQSAWIPLPDALRAATATPAAAIGIQDECGSLVPGLRADLTLFDDAFRIRRTWVGGIPVHFE